MRLVIFLASLLITFSAFAEQDKYQFDDKEQAVRFSELTKELRCPKCQNQTKIGRASCRERV